MSFQLPSDWRRMQIIFTWAQKWLQNVTHFIWRAYVRSVMLDKNCACQKLSPKLSKQPRLAAVTNRISQEWKKIRCVFTVDNITFICFRCALNSLSIMKNNYPFPWVGWLVVLWQYFSLNRTVSQREGETGEMIDERKNVQTTLTRTYCKRSKPLPYYNSS